MSLSGMGTEMRFAPALLDEIRSRVPLSGLIGQSVKLRKSGRTWTGLCPFHVERTPSFTCNDQRASYHCFGCGEHGDHFSFVQKRDGSSFIEAVEKLAREAGVPLPTADPGAIKREARKLDLADVLIKAQTWFRSQLQQSKTAQAYLANRGITPAIADQWGIGYAPDDRSALKQALSSVPSELLAESGLIVTGDEIPVPYDRFRNRIMIPIRDANGRLVAFGGRALGDSKAKYLNSPESILFQKSQLLFNAQSAREPAQDGMPLLIVEGFFDVITTSVAGHPAVVGTMGTAITEGHLLQAWRMSDRPVLCLDGDAAGQRAAVRAIDVALPLLRAGRSLAVATLPRNTDPDALIRLYGLGALRKAVDGAEMLSAVMYRTASQTRSTASADDLAAIESELAGKIGQIPDETLRRRYLDDMRRRLAREQRPIVPIVRANGHSHHSTSPGAIKLTRAPASRPLNLKEAVLLAGLIRDPAKADPEKISAERVSPHVKAVLDELCYLIGSVSPDELQSALAERAKSPIIDEARALCAEAGLMSLLQ